MAVAAFGGWHDDHEAARAVVAVEPRIVAHAALETYSVLTRLPEPFRAEPALVLEYMLATFPGDRPVLPPGDQRDLPERLARLGIKGGAVYDGLIGIAAAEYGVLLSLDRRAAETYELLGTEYRLLS